MLQVGLCLDDQTLKQALRLFKESKSLLIANIDSIGTGTVRRLIYYKYSRGFSLSHYMVCVKSLLRITKLI